MLVDLFSPSQVGSLFERSVVLVDKMQGKLDQNLQKAFDPQSRGQARGQQPTQDPFSLGMDLGFIHRVGMEEVLDSFFNFGKSVVEDFGDVVTRVFDDLKDVVEEERKRGSSNTKLETLLILFYYKEITLTEPNTELETLLIAIIVNDR